MSDIQTAPTIKSVEDMTEAEMLREILVTMRGVANGLTEATNKLSSHPLLKNFLK